MLFRSTMSLGATGSSISADTSISLPVSDGASLDQGLFLVGALVCLPVLDVAEEGRLCCLNVIAFRRAGQSWDTWRLF